jgi:hypothetical protein
VMDRLPPCCQACPYYCFRNPQDFLLAPKDKAMCRVCPSGSCSRSGLGDTVILGRRWNGELVETDPKIQSGSYLTLTYACSCYFSRRGKRPHTVYIASLNSDTKLDAFARLEFDQDISTKAIRVIQLHRFSSATPASYTTSLPTFSSAKEGRHMRR